MDLVLVKLEKAQRKFTIIGAKIILKQSFGLSDSNIENLDFVGTINLDTISIFTLITYHI